MRSGKDQQDVTSSANGTPANAVRGDASSGTPEPRVPRGSARGPTATVHSKDRDMGAALRSVYQKTIDERVPDEMLDLLGKLG